MVHLSQNAQFGGRFCHRLSILLHFIYLLTILSSSQSMHLSNSNGCPSEMLHKCAEPLQQLGISPGKNLVLLLLQLQSPNQLRKSCQAYANALPCFRKLVHRCGVPSQAEILRQMENAHQFLCSPFSAVEQSQLLAHRICIGRVLSQVGSNGTTTTTKCAAGGTETAAAAAMEGRNSTSMAIVLFRCRERCLAGVSESAKFGCLVRAWLSEQNLCLIEQLRAHCGREAAAFYTKMQRKIFHAQFPLICEQNVKNEATMTDQIKMAKNQSDGTVPLAMSATQATIFVTTKKRKKTVARVSELKLNFSASKKRGDNGNSNGTTKANNSRSNNVEKELKPTMASYAEKELKPDMVSSKNSGKNAEKEIKPTMPASSTPAAAPSPSSLASSSAITVGYSNLLYSSSSSSSPLPTRTSPSIVSSLIALPSSSSSSSTPPLPKWASITPPSPPPLLHSSATSASPPFLASNFTAFPFANSLRTNASSSSRRSRIIQLLAAHSVPFHFSSMLEQLHKRRNKSENGAERLPHVAPPTAAFPVQSSQLPFQSQFGPASSFPVPRPSSPSAAVHSLPFSSPPSSLPPPVSPLRPHSSSTISPPLSSFASSSLSDSSPPVSSPPLLLPPLLPFPSHPPHYFASPPFASSPPLLTNGHEKQQQQQGTSRIFFFEVLPIDEIIYKP